MEKNLALESAFRASRTLSNGISSKGRSDKYLRQFIHKIDNTSCVFVFEEFFRILPESRDFFSKDLTYIIEQTNSDVSPDLKNKVFKP